MTGRRSPALCLCACLLLAGCGSPGSVSGSAPHSAPSGEEPLAVPYETDFRLTSGHHTAGIDFPAGVYDLEAVQWCGTVISSNDAISLDMGTPEYNTDGQSHYEQTAEGVDLPTGTVLSLSGGVTLRLTCPDADPTPLTPREQDITEDVKLAPGKYTAGTDFPAGVYDFTALNGVGNVESSNMHDGGICDVMGTTWRIAEGFGFCNQKYENVSLPEGTVLNTSGVDLLLTPSE